MYGKIVSKVPCLASSDGAGWRNPMDEKTKAGLARDVAQGKKLGRPKGSKDKKKRKRRISFN